MRMLVQTERVVNSAADAVPAESRACTASRFSSVIAK